MKAIEGIPRIAFLGFFSSHILATLMIDVQAIAPNTWIPKPLADLLSWYATTLNDPLMSKPKELPWFQSLICMEMIFQLPFFFWIVSELTSNRKGVCVCVCVCVCTWVYVIRNTSQFHMIHRLYISVSKSSSNVLSPLSPRHL